MKITPVSGPQVSVDTGAQTPSQQDARGRAIAKLMGDGGAQAPIPVNPNAVSPEDFSAIQQRQASNTPPRPAQQPAAQPQPHQPEPAATPEENPLSSQLAQLARREKHLRAQVEQQNKTLAERENQLKAKEQEYQQKTSQYEQDYVSKEDLKANALRVLAEQGVDVSQLVEQSLNQTPTDPRVEAKINQLTKEIERLNKASEEAAKRSVEAQDQSYQAAIRQIDIDVANLVKTEAETYEMIALTGSQKDVRELIEQTWREDNRLMSTEEAAQEVENYLLEEAAKLANANKIKARNAPTPAPVQEPVTEQKPAAPQQQQMRTLTNAHSSTRQLSAREKAIMAFEGKNRS